MGGPGSGGVGGGGAGGGYVTNPRGPTSRYELKIDWKFPTYVEKVESQDGRTTAVQARRALSAEEAFKYLSGDDRRPLLVLRECLQCNGTDDALMTRNADNERTLLMSRWFHCVKLPPDVLAEDHPFHVLFGDEKPGHLFFARWDGTGRKDLTGQQSRTELWGLMESYLAQDYDKGVDGSLKALLAMLDRFDRLDADLASTREELDDLIEAGDGGSRKARKLQERLAELESGKARARADAHKLSELKLKQSTKAQSAQAPAPAGAGQG